MIEPTNGRIVWFTPPQSAAKERGLVHYNYDGAKPLAAMIVHVWNDRLVNLSVWDSDGMQHRFTSVPLLQDDDPKPEFGFFAAWMPYQKGQAAKTEALEAKVSSAG